MNLPTTPLATTATMLQKATETKPPNLNAVWKRIRMGPSVHRKMWNSSRYLKPQLLGHEVVALAGDVERHAEKDHQRTQYTEARGR
jgi:hypothetical protein